MPNASHLKLVSHTGPAPDAWLDAVKDRFSAEERGIVSRALDLADRTLRHQTRASGENALAHALDTADIVLGLRLSPEAVAAALLAPTLNIAPDGRVRERFGATVADLAEGVVRMDEIGALSSRHVAAKKPEQQAAQLEALRKMLLAMAKDIVYTHHEWWDGKGYPRGIKGDAIPIAGRLVAVVDVYDAMTARRLYRQPVSHEEAVALIVKGRGTHFDPDVVDAFVRIAPKMLTVGR